MSNSSEQLTSQLLGSRLDSTAEDSSSPVERPADIFSTRLPLELQCEIFHLAVYASHTSEDGPVNGIVKGTAICLASVSSVCQRWRKTALWCPILWTKIDLTKPEFAALCLERAGERSALIIQLDTTRLFALPREQRIHRVHALVRKLGYNKAMKTHPIHRIFETSGGRSRVRTLSILIEDPFLIWALDTFVRKPLPSLTRQTCCPRGGLSSWMANKQWIDLDLALASIQHEMPQYNILYEDLQAPKLQELALDTIQFRPFRYPLPHLTELKIGPSFFFSSSTFRDLCLWLKTLPQLKFLVFDNCKFPPFSAPPSSSITMQPRSNHGGYFSSSLRQLRILLHNEIQFYAASTLLEMIRPGCAVGVHLRLGYRLSEPAFCSIRESDLSDILQKMIAHNAPFASLQVLSKSTDESMTRFSLNFAHTNWSLSCASCGNTAVDASISIRTYSTSSLAQRKLQDLSTAFLKTYHAPTLEECWIDLPFSPSSPDWTSFLTHHTALKLLHAEQPDCGPLFLALAGAVEAGAEGAIVKADQSIVDWLDMIYVPSPLVPALEKHALGMGSWRVIIDYIRARHQLGKPLKQLGLWNSTGLTEKDKKELKQLMGGHHIFFR